MKLKNYYLPMIAALMACIFSSCQKEASNSSTKITTTTTTALAATVASTGSIAITTVAAVNKQADNPKDSIYLVGCMPGAGPGQPHPKKDTVAAAALLPAITTYLTANYSGYTFAKAFKITDSQGTVTAYVVAIKYNGNYVGLKFSATGSFVQVLEQRSGPDLGGPAGFHPGGPFDNRDGKCRDTISISALPAAVKAYFTATYPTDTLLHAEVTRDTSYILISKNSGLYATAITAAGKLINRMQIDPRPVKHTEVTQASLLAAITTYLTTTYPGYVFDKAFADNGPNNTILGYDLFITVNSTKYAVQFSATGLFVKAMVLR